VNTFPQALSFIVTKFRKKMFLKIRTLYFEECFLIGCDVTYSGIHTRIYEESGLYPVLKMEAAFT
jgi:hypothetical protein